MILIVLMGCIHQPTIAAAKHPCEGDGVHSKACETWAITYATCRARKATGAPPAAVLEGMTEADRKIEAAIATACGD